MDKHNSAQKNKGKHAKKPETRAAAPVFQEAAPAAVESVGKKAFPAAGKKK